MHSSEAQKNGRGAFTLSVLISYLISLLPEGCLQGSIFPGSRPGALLIQVESPTSPGSPLSCQNALDASDTNFIPRPPRRVGSTPDIISEMQQEYPIQSLSACYISCGHTLHSLEPTGGDILNPIHGLEHVITMICIVLSSAIMLPRNILARPDSS